MRARIAVVDDNAILANTTGRLISTMGFEPTVFTSARRFLETLDGDASAFDLVLTDQSMPELSGVELAAEVRKRRPGVPLLLVTGLTAANVDVTSIAPPMQVLAKPYRIDDLQEALRRLLAD